MDGGRGWVASCDCRVSRLSTGAACRCGHPIRVLTHLTRGCKEGREREGDAKRQGIFRARPPRRTGVKIVFMHDNVASRWWSSLAYREYNARFRRHEGTCLNWDLVFIITAFSHDLNNFKVTILHIHYLSILQTDCCFRERQPIINKGWKW